MKKNIWVIDDDPPTLEVIGIALEAEGYEVKTFTDLDFENFLQEACEVLPDLVITDVVMPKVSGFDVCFKIKEMFQPHPPPVIVMTGKLDAIDPVRARKMGADDFVVKTSGMAVLVKAVKKIFLEKGLV
ncbi:MAG TPA: response regulator [Candidatus Omnitrophota bacterium]|nr:response regulator [Candidatus Omnitrophota bacterium]